jgi:5-methylcytosine-specific restriction endonuclease McrA
LGSSKYWSRLRDKLVSQGYRCVYTGELLVLGVNDSLDHIYPASRFPERAKDPNNLK